MLCAITPTAERLSKLQRSVHTLALVCVIITHTNTHTHVALARSKLIVSLAVQILWAAKAEKGEVASPLMTTYGEKFQNCPSELHYFKGGAECL